MADRFRTVFNTGDTPVTVDEEGHSIGGGEWGTIDFSEAAAKALLQSGVLVEVDQPSSGVNPDAKGAFAATEKANAEAATSSSDNKSATAKGKE